LLRCHKLGLATFDFIQAPAQFFVPGGFDVRRSTFLKRGKQVFRKLRALVGRQRSSTLRQSYQELGHGRLQRD
jgi:hypothetical protein